ncbi:MAG: M56 family metallopeptidase [Bacteroidota bacterium]
MASAEAQPARLMIMLDTQAIISALGWTLFHSLWLGGLMAMLWALGKKLMVNHTSSHRYLTLVGLLGLFLSVHIGIFWTHYQDTQQIHASSASISTFSLASISFLSEADPDMALTAWEAYFSRIESWFPYLTILYVVGLLLSSLRLMRGYYQIHHLRTQSKLPASDKIQLQIRHLSLRLGVSQTAQLKIHPLVKEPMTIGFWKPIILFPVELLSGLNAEQLEAILLHELAHIKRADFLINQLQIFIEVLFFYHPAIWWISREIQLEREKCCDDIVRRVAGDPWVYAQTLTQLERFRQSLNPIFTMQATGKPSQLGIRIQRLFDPVPQKRVPIRGILAILVVMGLAFSPFLSKNQAIAMEPTSLSESIVEHEVDPLSESPTLEPAPAPKTAHLPLAPETHTETEMVTAGYLVPLFPLPLNRIKAPVLIDPNEPIQGDMPQILTKVDSPIKPVTVTVIGFEQGETKFKIKRKGKNKGTTQEEVRYFVDGVEVAKDDLKKTLKPKDIYSMEILSCENAQERFPVEEGEKVIAFHTKKKEAKKTEKKKKKVKIESDSSLGYTDKKGKIKNVLTTRPLADVDPLFILDGKIIDHSNFEEIPKDQIATIDVLKGESALKIYGPKGKDGVVVIKSKQGASAEKEIELKGIVIRDGLNLKTFPNPSTDRSTVISFQLEKASQVQIDIVDPFGKKIQTLVSGKLKHGSHRYVWDSQALPAGTFLVKVQVNGEPTVSRVVLE